MPRRLVLVGYRASGKSTIGALVARELGWSFVDLDLRLERELGAIAAFFAAHGEAAFRARESAALRALLSEDADQVVATGGGIVTVAANRAALRVHAGLVVYLAADAATLQARLRRDGGGRPSLTGAPIADEVPRLLAQRDPLYREVAAAVVDASATAAVVARQLVELARGRIDRPG